MVWIRKWCRFINLPNWWTDGLIKLIIKSDMYTNIIIEKDLVAYVSGHCFISSLYIFQYKNIGNYI